jgi:hypothetical protein
VEHHGGVTSITSLDPLRPALPRPPVILDRAVDDPRVVEDLLVAHQPYAPVQRYMANRAEYATLSGARSGGDPAGEVPIAPVFRGDWAHLGEVSPGVEGLLHHQAFVDGARQLFDAEIVRPHTVYVNLTWQLPFAQGRGHVDIPAFRGFDRSTVPVTFLTIMGLSGLFEAERVKVATAVAWFYEGADGGFEYWPLGADEAPVVHEGAIHNTAVVGDNDFMWHRVRPLGRPEDGMVTLSMDARVGTDDGTVWQIHDGDDPVARFGRDRLRVSLSWKADVFADDDERRRHDDHTDDLTEVEVLDRLAADLDARGLDATVPVEGPLRDPDFIGRLQDAYVRYPT